MLGEGFIHRKQAATPAVEMREIVKRFGTATALDQVSLRVHFGEIHALLGENGAGKSTLMHILSGLTGPDSGTLLLENKPVRFTSPLAARQAGIAMVHQHFTLVPAFTVSENLALARPASHLGFYSPRAAAESSLQRAEELGWKFPPLARAGDLSVGVQQRIEIIKALSAEAKILIFDEPTAVLSGDEVQELFSVLRRLKESGCAVILIAHKLSEILEVADRVTVLRRGREAATASIEDVTAEKLALWMVGEAASPSVLSLTSRSTPSARIVALQVQDVSIQGDRGETILQNLHFEVSEGEIYGIGGVDGNGQPELAETLVGLRKPAAGTMAWKGKLFAPGVHPKTGYIPQDRRRVGLAPTLTIEENLLFDAVSEAAYRPRFFLKRRALRDLAQRLVQNFDIRAASLRLPASSLSGGNQQKIVAARALRSQPEWIVAVNPTRGLDIGASRFVHQQLLEARSRGAAILLISTDLDELALLSDRTAMLGGEQLTPFEIETASAEDIGLLLGGAGGGR